MNPFREALQKAMLQQVLFQNFFGRSNRLQSQSIRATDAFLAELTVGFIERNAPCRMLKKIQSPKK